MSCQSNANRSAGAAVKTGIARLANLAAYSAAIGGGAVLGGGLGSTLGPLGTVGGVLLGGALGYRGVRAVKEQRARKAEEAAWQNSSAGQKAVKARGQALQKVRTAYQQEMAGLKEQKGEIETEYQAAKTTWLAQQTSKSAKAALSSPEARAVSNVITTAAITTAALGIAGEKIDKGFMTRAALGAVVAYPQELKNVQERQWQQAKREYQQQNEGLENQYHLARNAFLREHRGEQ